MTGTFIDEEFESTLITQIQELDIVFDNSPLKADYLEGNGITVNDVGEILDHYEYVPACLVGMGNIIDAVAINDEFTDYTITAQLHVWLQAYERYPDEIEIQEFSDINNLRRTIFKNLVGFNNYKAGNRAVQLRFQTDTQIANIDGVKIYEQIYNTIYRQFGQEGS